MLAKYTKICGLRDDDWPKKNLVYSECSCILLLLLRRASSVNLSLEKLVEAPEDPARPPDRRSESLERQSSTEGKPPPKPPHTYYNRHRYPDETEAGTAGETTQLCRRAVWWHLANTLAGHLCGCLLWLFAALQVPKVIKSSPLQSLLLHPLTSRTLPLWPARWQRTAQAKTSRELMSSESFSLRSRLLLILI